MTQPKPKRCAVATCGREPIQVEHYETNPNATDGNKGAVAREVCCGHTGIGKEGWRLVGIEPVPARVHATTAGQ